MRREMNDIPARTHVTMNSSISLSASMTSYILHSQWSRLLFQHTALLKSMNRPRENEREGKDLSRCILETTSASLGDMEGPLAPKISRPMTFSRTVLLIMRERTHSNSDVLALWVLASSVLDATRAITKMMNITEAARSSRKCS